MTYLHTIYYDQEHDGQQVDAETGAEDAGGGRADKTGPFTQKSERGSGGGASDLFSADRVAHKKGAPTVAIGIYLRVLYALQLDDDILWLAKEDKLGKALQDLSLKTRKRASKKE